MKQKLVLATILLSIILSCSKPPEIIMCTDGLQNGNEIGIDCGGACPNCPTCDDGVQNGEEQGIDCGGDCPDPCHCSNGIKDGNEYCVDCGGDCADCNASTSRYLENVFPKYLELSNDDFFRNSGEKVVYGKNIFPSGTERDLTLTIYEPESDKISNRPIILMLGGTPLYFAPINEQLAKPAKDFVGKGYVVAMVGTRYYDKGTVMNKEEFTDALIKARADVLAAIRFVRKNAVDLNVDTENIWLMGYSGGALISLYAAFLTENEIGDMDELFSQTLTNNGGFEGDSGNPDFDSSVRGVINLAGFIIHDHLIDPGDPLLFSLIGVNDSYHSLGQETRNEEWLSFSIIVYGPQILHENYIDSKLKIIGIAPANEWAALDDKQCPECPDEMSGFIAMRMYCE